MFVLFKAGAKHILKDNKLINLNILQKGEKKTIKGKIMTAFV